MTMTMTKAYFVRPQWHSDSDPNHDWYPVESIGPFDTNWEAHEWAGANLPCDDITYDVHRSFPADHFKEADDGEV